MPDPTPQQPAHSLWDLPAHIKQLLAQHLQNMSLKANPADPNDPTGFGGAQRKAALDKQIADAGG